MSGCPETIPSARDSARSSSGYLLESVRKGGAGGWGRSPSLPIAWQREQLSLTIASPLVARSFSAAAAEFPPSKAAPKGLLIKTLHVGKLSTLHERVKDPQATGALGKASKHRIKKVLLPEMKARVHAQHRYIAFGW